MPFQQPPKICPICQEGKLFKFVKDYRSKSGKFSLFECELCKIQFWTPFKNPGVDWYEKQDSFTARGILRYKIYRDYHKKFLKLYKNLPPNIKVLDLGCGISEFIAELQKRGCEVWGVDFDKNFIEIAKKNFNLKNVYTMSFDDFFQKQDIPQFDIITFFEVIEHLDNPLKFIQNAKKILKPGGKIILSTPERERLLVNLAHLDFPPHHLTRWNREAVSNLFKKINFGISHIEHIGQFGCLMSAINEKFRTGLVNKTAELSKGNNKKLVMVKLVHLGGNLKDYLIGGIPAIFLWLFSKLTKHENGTILIEFKKRRKRII